MGCVKDTIQMAQPTVTITGTYELHKGEALGTLTLTGTAMHEGNPVEGTLAWKDPSTTYTETGEQPAAWIFTPADLSRYSPDEGETKVTVNPNIYVCGYRNMSNGGDYINTIWKNGKELYTLPLSYNMINSLAVSGGDVYSCGYESSKNPNSKTVGKVWKNDQTLYTLEEGSVYTIALSLTIANGKIYTTGSQSLPTGRTVLKVWENGIATWTGENKGAGYSIVVSGGNVYLFGVEGNDQNNYVAKVWKDGNLLYDNLSDGNYDFYSGNMVISDGDIYTCGTEKYSALNPKCMKVWKNKTLLYALKSDKNGNVSNLAVSNGDVYMCGWENGPTEKSVIKVWKNGDPLYDLTDGNQYGYPYAIGLYDDDVYIAGTNYHSGSNPVSKIWKNGDPIFTKEGFVFKAMLID